MTAIGVYQGGFECEMRMGLFVVFTLHISYDGSFFFHPQIRLANLRLGLIFMTHGYYLYIYLTYVASSILTSLADDGEVYSIYLFY